MMDTLLISQRLSEAIQNYPWKGCGVKGFLIGQSREYSTVLAVWQNNNVDTASVDKDVDDCLSHFPAGKSVIGIVLAASQGRKIEGLIQELSHLFGSVETFLELFGQESFLVLSLNKRDNDNSSKQGWETSFALVTKSDVKPLDVSYGCDMNSGIGTRMRLQADFPLLFSYSSDGDRWSCSLKDEHKRLNNSLQTGAFVFGFDGNRALLHKKGTILGSDCRNWKLVKDIKKYLKDIADEREEKPPGPTNRGVQNSIAVSLLQRSVEKSDSICHAPIIAHCKGDLTSVQLKLPVDVLVEVKDDLSISKLYNVLIKSVSRQISALFKCLEQSYSQSNQFSTPEVFHLKPSCLGTSVSIVYPKGLTDDELEKDRRSYHDQLLLAKDRPYLRKACAGIFLSPTAPGGYLVNPHIGLSLPQSVKNVKPSLVDGYYSYHHYMQDRFNDDKWGCAYRSLQTIVSWFKYQGYTDKNIPSHREIQQALYKCGDKGEKFVGSRQWSGSFEVSFVLDHLLGVSSKFINVNSGAELSTTGQQLMNHFQTQGTPVMIGGGVLAHTILGVAYDEMTGEIAFLILDPHYTGGEDLKIVQDKGWCGWKSMKFWDQTAHYNMCLPQRPVAI